MGSGSGSSITYRAPGQAFSFLLTDSPSRETRPCSIKVCKALRESVGHCAASHASKRPLAVASAVISNRSIRCGPILLFCPLFVPFFLERIVQDPKHQQNHAGRNAYIGKIKHRKIDEENIDIIHNGRSGQSDFRYHRPESMSKKPVPTGPFCEIAASLKRTPT